MLVAVAGLLPLPSTLSADTTNLPQLLLRRAALPCMMVDAATKALLRREQDEAVARRAERVLVLLEPPQQPRHVGRPFRREVVVLAGVRSDVEEAVLLRALPRLRTRRTRPGHVRTLRWARPKVIASAAPTRRERSHRSPTA